MHNSAFEFLPNIDIDTYKSTPVAVVNINAKNHKNMKTDYNKDKWWYHNSLIIYHSKADWNAGR